MGVGPGEYEKGLQNVEERLSLKQKQFDDNSSLTSEMQDAQNIVTRYKEKLAVAENSINEIESTFKQYLTKTKSPGESGDSHRGNATPEQPRTSTARRL